MNKVAISECVGVNSTGVQCLENIHNKATQGNMIVVGGRQTWPDVTLTMILSDT